MTKTILTEEQKIAKYDAERAGTAYAQPAELPAAPLGTLRTQIDGLRDQLDATQDVATRRQLFDQFSGLIRAEEDALEAERGSVLLGHIDALEVRAHYMADDDEEGGGALAWATVVWQGMKLSTDGHSYFNLPTSGGMSGDMEIAQWQEVKRLAQTDIPERLIALAQCYPRFCDAPAVPPVACSVALSTPLVSIEYLYHNPKQNGDLTSKPVGPLAYLDYVCGKGDTRACVSYDVERGELVGEINSGEIEGSLDDAEQAARNFLALLSDPRVVALRRNEAIALETPDEAAPSGWGEGYQQGYDDGVCHAMDVIVAEMKKRKAA